MERANADLRKAAKEAKVPFWAVADYMGISEPQMTRKLRYELSEKEKAEIMATIETLKEG